MIKYGVTDKQIKAASLKELADALLTPDGCGCEGKRRVLQELVARAQEPLNLWGYALRDLWLQDISLFSEFRYADDNLNAQCQDHLDKYLMHKDKWLPLLEEIHAHLG